MLSDSEIVLCGIAAAFVVAVVAFYLVEDEIERKWHEKELKRLKVKKNMVSGVDSDTQGNGRRIPEAPMGPDYGPV